MSLPRFVRSPAFLSGAGVLGSGAVGIGGWQLVEEVYPIGDQRLSKLGFHSHTPQPKLEADVDTGSHSSGENPFTFKSYGCFQNFFPGATVNHSLSNTPTTNDNFSAPPKEDIASDTNPIGCVLMNLSYETKSDTQEIKYIFKAEVTAKNDRFGWSLWAGTKRLKPNGVSSSGSQSIARYYLTFLQRTSDGWGVLGGYSWYDLSLSQEQFASQTKIFSPKKEDGNWYSLTQNTSESKKKLFKEYAGVWEVTKEGNEIFQDIVLWAGADGQRYSNNEILGREFRTGSSEMDFNKGYDDIGYGGADYTYESGSGWKKLTGSTGKDITQTLNDMYSPFKGKKGKWREVEEYCNSQRFRRTSKGYLYTLQNFCYKKQAEE